MTALNLTRQRPVGERLGARMPSIIGRPVVPDLIDRFGRTAADLRISVTEKCSLRCTYCMPAEGLPAVPRRDLLTPAEIGRLVGIGVRRLGVREVRFTGGEPLMRADLTEIIGAARRAAPSVPLAITTNAVGLDKRLPALLAAGLTRVNVSLDTLDREHFAHLTRRDRLPAVLAGIDAVRRAGLTPLKINAVLMRETLADAPDLLAWSLQRGVRLRFIEQMPLDADGVWTRDGLVDAAELLRVLSERFELTPVGRDDLHAPAEEWRAVDRAVAAGRAGGADGSGADGSGADGSGGDRPGADGSGVGTVGVIASVTRSFCVECDRTRLTAEGSVRACLFGDDETPLAPLLRGGADDHAVADAWRAAMWGKRAGHGMDEAGFRRPQRSMGAIGG